MTHSFSSATVSASKQDGILGSSSQYKVAWNFAVFIEFGRPTLLAMGNELATFSFHSRTFETRRVYLFPKALLFTGSHASNDGTPASHERIKPFSWMVTGWFDEVLYFLKKRSEDLKNSFRHTCEVKTLNSIQVSWTSNVFYSKGGWDQRSFMADLMSKMKKITFPCEFLAALGPGSWRTVFVFWWPRLRYPTCPTLLRDRSIIQQHFHMLL